MAATPQPWVIRDAQAIADDHGLLHLHLKVSELRADAATHTHVYRVDLDTAGEVIDALLRVTEDSSPGSSEE